MRDFFSKDFTRLLYGMLNKDPDQRMCIHEIQKHPFFKKIEWENFENKIGLKPPIKPKVKNVLKVGKRDRIVLETEL